MKDLREGFDEFQLVNGFISRNSVPLPLTSRGAREVKTSSPVRMVVSLDSRGFGVPGPSLPFIVVAEIDEMRVIVQLVMDISLQGV